MWFLVDSTGKFIYLRPNKLLTFGRKSCDIRLEDDGSISREHGCILVQPKECIEDNEPTSICNVIDLKSKYGTFVLRDENQYEVTAEKYLLKHGDSIKFGLQNHIFRIHYEPLITVTSGLTSSERAELQSLLDKVDGFHANKFSEICTHLTVSEPTLTEKVSWALASGIHIVTLDYWRAVKDACRQHAKVLPDPGHFVPPISEGLVNRGNVSLSRNENRKTLFKNRIFVHFNLHQYKVYGQMIHMAGGVPIFYAKKPLTLKELTSPNVVALQYPLNEASEQPPPEYENIYRFLRANGRRMISDCEIPLAILYCSVETYCNPVFDFRKLLSRSQRERPSSSVLVHDTQDVAYREKSRPTIISDVVLKSHISVEQPVNRRADIIPETCDILNTLPSTSQLHELGTSQRKTASKASKSYIPETVETEIIPESATHDITERSKQLTPKSNNNVFIPETLSFDTSNTLRERQDSSDDSSTVEQSSNKQCTSKSEHSGTSNNFVQRDNVKNTKGGKRQTEKSSTGSLAKKDSKNFNELNQVCGIIDSCVLDDPESKKEVPVIRLSGDNKKQAEVARPISPELTPKFRSTPLKLKDYGMKRSSALSVRKVSLKDLQSQEFMNTFKSNKQHKTENKIVLELTSEEDSESKKDRQNSDNSDNDKFDVSAQKIDPQDNSEEDDIFKSDDFKGDTERQLTDNDQLTKENKLLTIQLNSSESDESDMETFNQKNNKPSTSAKYDALNSFNSTRDKRKQSNEEQVLKKKKKSKKLLKSPLHKEENLIFNDSDTNSKKQDSIRVPKLSNPIKKISVPLSQNHSEHTFQTTSSFLRNKPGGKTFTKVFQKIPEKRITMIDLE